MNWDDFYQHQNGGKFFDAMRANLQRSRDRLSGSLRAAGFAVLPSEGTYSLNVDLAASNVHGEDHAICRRLVLEAGVAAIPLSAFYASCCGPSSLIRLCFAKMDSVLGAAVYRLTRWVERSES